MPFFIAVIVSLLSACGEPEPASQSPAEKTDTPAAQSSQSPAKVLQAGKGTGKKKAIPRIEGKNVTVVSRVDLKIKASGKDKAGDKKTCRATVVLGPVGTPMKVIPMGCDPAYSDAVEENLMGWRFAPS